MWKGCSKGVSDVDGKEGLVGYVPFSRRAMDGGAVRLSPAEVIWP